MSKLVFNRASFEFHNEIIEWCREQFGTDIGKDRRWFIGDRLHGHLVLHFNNEQDHLLTIEKWK